MHCYSDVVISAIMTTVADLFSNTLPLCVIEPTCVSFNWIECLNVKIAHTVLTNAHH